MELKSSKFTSNIRDANIFPENSESPSTVKIELKSCEFSSNVRVEVRIFSEISQSYDTSVTCSTLI